MSTVAALSACVRLLTEGAAPQWFHAPPSGAILLPSGQCTRPTNLIADGTCRCWGEASFPLDDAVMSDSLSDRNSLEEMWRCRVENAGLRLDFARIFVEEIEKDFADAVPPAEGTFPYALRAQNVAAVEYGRLLRIYVEFVVNGKPPDEGDCPATRKAAQGVNS